VDRETIIRFLSLTSAFFVIETITILFNNLLDVSFLFIFFFLMTEFSLSLLIFLFLFLVMPMMPLRLFVLDKKLLSGVVFVLSSPRRCRNKTINFRFLFCVLQCNISNFHFDQRATVFSFIYLIHLFYYRSSCLSYFTCCSFIQYVE
jgi:hypothetical protein